MLIMNKMKNKKNYIINKNTTLSDHFQNPISKQRQTLDTPSTFMHDLPGLSILGYYLSMDYRVKYGYR